MVDTIAADDLIERFANAFLAYSHRTISEREFEEARNELRAALTATPRLGEPTDIRREFIKLMREFQDALNPICGLTIRPNVKAALDSMEGKKPARRWDGVNKVYVHCD